MKRTHLAALAAIGLLAATGTGVGLGFAAAGSPAPASGSASAASLPTAATSGGTAEYAYYQSVMARLDKGSMMGGAGHGYAWMMGGSAAPGWMTGESLPGSMMGGGTDPGAVMGRLFADAPGPRVDADQAARLADAVPTGALVDTATHTVTFTSPDVSLTVLAVPSAAGGSFRLAGLVDPTVAVPLGARVTLDVVNTDPNTAHGLVVTSSTAASSAMPMMSARPAFPGAALWFLGEPTAAGMHVGTLTFTAAAPGTYRYLCPVPARAAQGMGGTFTVMPGA